VVQANAVRDQLCPGIVHWPF